LAVLSMMIYETEDEAVAIANNTTYGLAGHVQGADMDRVRNVAARIYAAGFTSTARHVTGGASRLAATNNRAMAAGTGYSVSKNISR
jgi:acyl-CoA reductase-like NAD-dependent aldehyde dehydrogenase